MAVGLTRHTCTVIYTMSHFLSWGKHRLVICNCRKITWSKTLALKKGRQYNGLKKRDKTFEDTRGLIRIHYLKKSRQYNGWQILHRKQAIILSALLQSFVHFLKTIILSALLRIMPFDYLPLWYLQTFFRKIFHKGMLEERGCNSTTCIIWSVKTLYNFDCKKYN
jgi:hypothetical protein